MRMGITFPLRPGVATQLGLLPGEVRGNPTGRPIGHTRNQQRPQVAVGSVKQPLGITSSASSNASDHTPVVQYKRASTGPALEGPNGAAQLGTGDCLPARYRAGLRHPPTINNVSNRPRCVAQPRICGVGSPAVAAGKRT